MAALFDTTIVLLTGSQLEDNLEKMLWSLTANFHRRLTQIQKLLDDNEFEVRESLAIHDGSKVASVEFERLRLIGHKLWDHREAFEQMRDLAVNHFSAATGSPWLPRTESMVSHRGLTSKVMPYLLRLLTHHHSQPPRFSRCLSCMTGCSQLRPIHKGCRRSLSPDPLGHSARVKTSGTCPSPLGFTYSVAGHWSAARRPPLQRKQGDEQ